MNNLRAFLPFVANTVNIDVGAATASVALGGGAATRSVRVMNDGTATAWIKFGDSTVTAALATGIPVGAGVTEVLLTRETHVAAIAAGATGKIYFTPGEGV